MNEKVPWRDLPAGAKAAVVALGAAGSVIALGVLAVLLGLLARAVDWAWS